MLTRGCAESPLKKSLVVPFLLIAAFAALVHVRGVAAEAPVPDVFSDARTFEQALAESGSSGRPVFALATADWCGPCQSLKRGALSDPRLADLLRTRTVPVYLEEAAAMPEIQRLGVRAYPTAVIIRDGKVDQMIEGGAGPDEYLRMVRAALGVAE